MEQNQKNAIVSLISGLGVIFLLIGIFTNYYDFGVGLILGMACWIISGALSTYLQTDKKHYHQHLSRNHIKNSYSIEHDSKTDFDSKEKIYSRTTTFCKVCGAQNEKDSVFCTQCGSELVE